MDHERPQHSGNQCNTASPPDSCIKQKETHPRLGLANNCLVGEGTAVAVDEASELSLSLSPMGCIVDPPAGCSGIMGASEGSLASFALAKDFWSSLMGELEDLGGLLWCWGLWLLLC